MAWLRPTLILWSQMQIVCKMLRFPQQTSLETKSENHRAPIRKHIGFKKKCSLLRREVAGIGPERFENEPRYFDVPPEHRGISFLVLSAELTPCKTC